jgi:hypothetical protein
LPSVPGHNARQHQTAAGRKPPERSISYGASPEAEGVPAAVEELERTLEERTSPAVKKALAYVEKLEGKRESCAFTMDIVNDEIGDDWEMPDAFVVLSKAGTSPASLLSLTSGMAGMPRAATGTAGWNNGPI